MLENVGLVDFAPEIKRKAVEITSDSGNALHAPDLDRDGIGRPLDGDLSDVALADIGAYEFVHPSADTDGDGMLDAAEVIAGTNPADSNSILRVRVRYDPVRTGVLLTWPSVIGRTYRVESTPSLSPARTWEFLSIQLHGTGTDVEIFDDAAGQSSRFYRIQVESN